MIIRRMAEGIRTQNWFTVVIEIFIVVIGIFLGLQVTEWNEDRQNRVQERQYLNRLHDELLDGLEANKDNFESMQTTRRHLNELLNTFDQKNTTTSLGKMHCYAVFASHVYVNRAADLPSVVELMASGQLPLIQSEDIRTALSRFTLAGDELDSLVMNITNSMLVLSRKYPHLIKLDRKMRNIDDLDSIEHDCDFDAMKASQAFGNDLIDNTARNDAFVSTVVRMSDLLESLHKTLDRELSIAHTVAEGETP